MNTKTYMKIIHENNAVTSLLKLQLIFFVGIQLIKRSKISVIVLINLKKKRKINLNKS